MDVSEVPIAGDNLPFVICERARVQAIEEALEASDNEARLEATMVAVHLWPKQLEIVNQLLNELSEHSKFDPDYAPFSAWLEAWMEQLETGSPRWIQYQRDLVAAVGEERAQEISDQRGTPRMQAVKEEIRAALRQKLRDTGAEPEVPEPPSVTGKSPSLRSESRAEVTEDVPAMKTCPDCAEDVRAAARKCRYCGYRFDVEDGSR